MRETCTSGSVGARASCDKASRIEGLRRKPGAHPTGSLTRRKPGLPDVRQESLDKEEGRLPKPCERTQRVKSPPGKA
jgi:hypothetical protein